MAGVTEPIVLDSTAKEMLEVLKSIANATKRLTFTITMESVNGTPVTGEQVIITNTATGTVLHRIDYYGTPVTVELNQDTEYMITGTSENISTTGFYAPSKVTGVAQSDTNITIEYQNISDMSSLEAVRVAIANHPGVEILPVGTSITVSGRKFVLMGYGYPTLEDGTQKWGGQFLHVHYKNSNDFMMDARETEEATESTAIDGLYYYGKSGSAITHLNLNAGDEIPYSDYDVVYHNTILDADASMIKYGCCLYKRSAKRMYLNSDTDVYGGWWHQDHIGDVKDASFDAFRGWLYGLSEIDINAIATVRVRSYNPYTEQMDEMYDKVFLPSVTEVYGIAEHDEGTPFKLMRELVPPNIALPSNNIITERVPGRLYAPNYTSDGRALQLRTYGNKRFHWKMDDQTYSYNPGIGLELYYTSGKSAEYGNADARTKTCASFWLC